GYYYCIGTQTSTGLTAQSLSNGRLMVGELKSYYPFETTYTVGNSLFTPDVVSGKDMQLMGGAGLSDYDAIAGNHLLLENPAGATLEWAQIADTTVAHYEDITIACWVRPTTLVNTIDRDRWTRVWDFGKEATEAFFLTMLYRQNDPRQGGWDVARSEWNWYTPDENGDGQPERHNQELDVEAEIVPEKWYYMVVTVENGYGRIYLNGECGTENEAPQGLPLQSPINFTKTYNYIGKAVGATVPYLNARIDELKIYNYAMNKQEIAEEYNRVTGVESVCDLEIYDLYDWDFNRNCKVDLPDFAEIAARWMMDYRIFPE
ncbi:MAG TPA: LamG domain-containing protein, partial [Anaerohalosphaeraceae bacterium]|nr:LamG domain-containing protein [Anaerohalosphaeraceae bacterium]